MTALLPAVVGLLCGVVTLLLVRRFSDQTAIRTTKARIRAHLYELRLFGDDPVLILRANKKLLLRNMRYLKLTLPSAAMLVVPALVATLQLDALYGRRSLNQGEAVLVTAQLKALDLEPVLVVTPSFHIESSAVRIPSLQQATWRVRAIESSDGTLQLRLPGEVVEVPIRVGTGLRYIAKTCPSSIWGLMREGCSIRSNLAEFVAIDYPPGGANWAAWFAFSWVATVLILRRRFGVIF